MYTHTRSLERKLKNHHFDGLDPICILEFLQRFLLAWDATRIHEGGSICLLPSLLHGSALDNLQLCLETGTHGPSGRFYSLSNYSLEVKYLLRTYVSYYILVAAK